MIIGWKKVFIKNSPTATIYGLAKLEIIGHIIGAAGPNGCNKLRTSRAKVLSIKELSANGKIIRNRRKATSILARGETVEYRVGGIVAPLNGFDTNLIQCSSGIHFFLERKRAIRYR